MFPLASPFRIYSEMFKLGIQTSQMLMSSGEVIFQRSQMINQAMSGKLPWTDPEFTKLWQEKIFANMAAYNSMSKSVVRNLLSKNSGSMEKHLTDGIKAIKASTLPYHKKAGSNAKRFRNKRPL